MKAKKSFLLPAFSLIVLSLVVIIQLYSIRIASNSQLFNIHVASTFISQKFFNRTNNAVIEGKNGFLFYLGGLSSILKPWPFFDQNIQKIVSLHTALAKKSSYLVIVPVPDKEYILPNYYSPVMPAVVSNQRKRFVSALKDNGLHVVDLSDSFYSNQQRDKLFRKTDTHWDHYGIEIAAKQISAVISPLVGFTTTHQYLVKDTFVSEQGDLARFIQDSSTTRRTIKQVINLGAEAFRDSPQCNLLIFGDSFAQANRQYSGNIGAHLSLQLQTPSYTHSRLLANVNGPSMLLNMVQKSKNPPKIIVWIFATRFLVQPFN